MSKPETPLLDQLESGSWSSFVSGLKRLAASDDKPLMKDLLGQLEGSYETRRGYWKGGTVGVSGYGAGVDRRRVSRIGRVPHAAAHSAGGNALQYRPPPLAVRHLGETRLRSDRAARPMRHHAAGLPQRERPALLRRSECARRQFRTTAVRRRSSQDRHAAFMQTPVTKDDMSAICNISA